MDMQSRLKQLGSPIYGYKDTLWKRLRDCEYSVSAELACRAEMPRAAEERRAAQGEHRARILVVLRPPSEQEKIMHELTRIPAKAWCQQCVRCKAACCCD